MNTLFINSDAFSSLNITDNPNHTLAVAFVNELFSQTVKLYTSQTVVLDVCENIRRQQGYAKMQQFLLRIANGGFVVLIEDKKTFERAVCRVADNSGSELLLMDAIIIEQMKEWGIKDIFSFRPQLKDYNVIVIPVITENKGSIVTTVKTVDEPIISKDDSGNEKIYYETTTTETKKSDEGSLTKTEKIEYDPSRVGVTIQFLNASRGDVLWTNSYWYSSLSLSNAVNECIYGSLKPLKKLLK